MKTLNLALATLAITGLSSVAVADSRAFEKNYLGSSSFTTLNQESELNYLLQREPTAAGIEGKESKRFMDSRAQEKNYLGSSNFRTLDKEQGLNYLLKREPTAAGPTPPKGIAVDSRYFYKNYLGADKR